MALSLPAIERAREEALALARRLFLVELAHLTVLLLLAAAALLLWPLAVSQWRVVSPAALVASALAAVLAAVGSALAIALAARPDAIAAARRLDAVSERDEAYLTAVAPTTGAKPAARVLAAFAASLARRLDARPRKAHRLARMRRGTRRLVIPLLALVLADAALLLAPGAAARPGRSETVVAAGSESAGATAVDPAGARRSDPAGAEPFASARARPDVAELIAAIRAGEVERVRELAYRGLHELTGAERLRVLEAIEASGEAGPTEDAGGEDAGDAGAAGSGTGAGGAGSTTAGSGAGVERSDSTANERARALSEIVLALGDAAGAGGSVARGTMPMEIGSGEIAPTDAAERGEDRRLALAPRWRAPVEAYFARRAARRSLER